MCIVAECAGASLVAVHMHKVKVTLAIAEIRFGREFFCGQGGFVAFEAEVVGVGGELGVGG